MKSSRIPRSLTFGLTLTPLGSAVVSRERLQARVAAEKIIQAAEERAREIEARAGWELEQARSRGLEEGRRDGERELAERIAQAERLREIAADRHLPGLIRLATRMAARILRGELDLHPDRIRDICRAVLHENRPGQKLKLLVNPGDLTRLQDERHPLTADPEIQIELDASVQVEPGGCIVHSELGEVDARLSVQLEELSRALGEVSHD